ncbi:hypothetical protein PROFUN_11590 [Planoprotostelium fungivorum]|uniref:Intraflagellar transport protein 122 homolog n=1 Tax=Planoprotostelium fungivorum TaxID=1890364 RepID=A0A2P6N9U2_9EUKA|nr:hypothetical protein PROFUN_11590 [Planoprotostelium fungivorum]
MRTITTWLDRVSDRDNVKQPIYDLAFRPDGTQLVVSCGQRVNVYNTADGEVIQRLKGHKGTVYCVAYSKDGKRFASGGSDSQIIIWAQKQDGFAGILKYNHNEPIQCIAYNPITQQLASCTATDFGLWSPEQKAVNKKGVSSKILCCAWTNDGQYLALGHFSGVISIRDKDSNEKVKIERKAPIWCLAWNPSRDDPVDILAVGDWGQKLSFYQLIGRQVTKDKELGFDPCSIGYFSNGEYLIIGGSDKKVSLWTKEGVRLTTVIEKSDWFWACKVKPRQNYVATGSNDGTVTLSQMVFSTVHGLYQDKYAYRDFMTDVMIQNLVTEQKVRIKCRDYVKKIAIYKDRLAVQLSNQVVIYELLSNDDQTEMNYKPRWKIQRALECNLLVVTSQHIILCQEKKLQLLNFRGDKEREWVLESLIRYIKVVGGPVGREGLLVGLKSGLILEIFLDNSFPINLIKQKSSVRCLDLSCSRMKLAVVDENNNCLVYNLATKELLFQETNANSVAWNSDLEDMLCFSGNGLLNIKASTFPVHQQKMQGFVVGFKGSRIFCLHIYAMQAIDVPQSASLYRYLEKGDFSNAFKIACLGVTESDWRLLAIEALQHMDLVTARKAFIRIRDLKFIELINMIEQAKKRSGFNEKMHLGDAMAYQGKYTDAAQIYATSGNIRKTIEMYCDLRLWEKAREWAQTTDAVDIVELIRMQAGWAEETGDWKAAVELWMAAGMEIKAVTIYGNKGWTDDLYHLVQSISSEKTPALEKAAEYFKSHGQTQYAIETYLRIGNQSAVLSLYTESQRWDEAMRLIESGETKVDVKRFWLPYAHWLAIHDRFEEAQEAFMKAEQPEAASQVLEELTSNAVLENRYEDASYYFWLLSQEYLKLIKGRSASGLSTEEEGYLLKFQEFRELSDIYFAYSFIFRYTDDPFTTLHPETVFNIARYLLNAIPNKAPLGISKLYILFALAKHAKDLGAFKLARFTYDKLQQLRLPNNWIDQIDLATLTIRSKPFSDREDHQPVCNRCSTANPLVGVRGNFCTNCKHPFLYSFGSFEILPLVEFYPDDDITDEEAERLIERDPPIGGLKSNNKADSLVLGEHVDTFETDPFARVLDRYEQEGVTEPVFVSRDVLVMMRRTEVFVKRWNSVGVRNQYYKLMVPEVPVILCPSCYHFFHEEDYEVASMQKHRCPVCRVSSDGTL